MSDSEIRELYAASYRRVLGQLIGVTGRVTETDPFAGTLGGPAAVRVSVGTDRAEAGQALPVYFFFFA